MALATACLYTTRKSEGLLESGNKTVHWAVNQRYVAALREFERAQESGLAMPVVIADVDNCRHLIAWGIVTDVSVAGAGTQLGIGDLRPLSGRLQRELRVLKSGKPLARGFIRPYAMVQTPSYLMQEAPPEAAAPVAVPVTKALPEGMNEFPLHIGLSVEAPFQEWRTAHPEGHVLTFITGSRALLLSVRCGHVGRLRPKLEETAAISPRRLCAVSVELLRSWAHSNEVQVDTCRQCEREAPLPLAAGGVAVTHDSSVLQHVLEVEEEAEAGRIGQRVDIAAMEKAALVRARRGHGVFRENLEKIEIACRVTGILDRRHLRASHIKPWCRSDDQEKLDGHNGLLLSPHVEHLFVRGYISFTDTGELLVSAQMNVVVLNTWGLKAGQKAGAFKPEQCRYLAYHRQHIFDQQERGRRGRGTKQASRPR